jgi:hypothetical protein
MNLQHLHQFTARLAEGLTGLGLEGVWKAQAVHGFCWVALADNPAVRLNLRQEPGKSGRLVLRPEYPRDGRSLVHTGGGPVETGYGRSRSPDDIARDLQRRLLPPFRTASGADLHVQVSADATVSLTLRAVPAGLARDLILPPQGARSPRRRPRSDLGFASTQV